MSFSLPKSTMIPSNLDSNRDLEDFGAVDVEFDSASMASSICPAPVCRQFWKAGKYEVKATPKATNQNVKSYLHIHPKFLHSNATSHKWVFGAIAELVDNSVDEVQNGATFVVLDQITNPRDGSRALLIQDDGGGMDPEAMGACLSFGFSDKKMASSIGKYGNGFKTSSMRLGADVIVFSRCTNGRKRTQSIGLLSYTFLMQTGQDRVVVPKVDFQFDVQSSTWKAIQDEQKFNMNLSVLLQWSPFSTLDELLMQCEKILSHGTRIIIYNLWHDDFGQAELDFESDSEDVLVSGKRPCANVSLRKEISENHLANRLHYSLRAYLSILYLQIPEKFCIVLRGQVVAFHIIAKDLIYPEFILYKPQNVEGSVITSIGFLKEAPKVNINGFNVYHKNRLILPFWHVGTYSSSRGRGVVGILEANFIEPTHNKQDFEKTPVFQKLQARLREMTLEYWDYHCELIGYQRVIKSSRVTHKSSHPWHHGVYQQVVLSKESDKINPPVPKKPRTLKYSHNVSSENWTGASLKTSRHGNVPGQEKNIADSAKELDQETSCLMQENRRLRIQHDKFEKVDKELDIKMARLTSEVEEAESLYERLLSETKLLEKAKEEHRGGVIAVG